MTKTFWRVSMGAWAIVAISCLAVGEPWWSSLFAALWVYISWDQSRRFKS